MMDGPVRVVIERGGDGAIVVKGELDAASSQVLDEAIEIDGLPGTNIVVDMADVTFIDSSALNVLVKHRRRLHEEGHHLELRNPSGIVNRVLEVAGLDNHFRVLEED